MYKNKLSNYQGDCPVYLGRLKVFSDYIKEFANSVSGLGLDLGAGPGGCNSLYFQKTDVKLDGCDVDEDIVMSFPKDNYNKKFNYTLGCDKKLPYDNNELDFVVCSCVIQHLNSMEELNRGLHEIARVLKKGGKFYLMFKAGTNDTLLTHHNKYYNEERQFRVFEPNNIEQVVKQFNMTVKEEERALDNNWIPYSKMIIEKN